MLEPADKKTEPLVSIVMPAYNAADFIESAINSVLSQTYLHWELLVVNDASKDCTLKVANKLAEADKRIKVFDQPANQGVAKARNRAIGEARGKYIAFLDSDDLWDAEKLAKQIDCLETTKIDICYCNYRRINESGERLGSVKAPKRADYKLMLKSNFIGNLTGLYNAESLGKQYLSDFKHEDYVAWLALVKRSETAIGLEEELASYRVYSGSTSSNKLKTIGWQWKIYRESEKLGLLHSFWMMTCYAYYAVLKRSG